MSPGEVPEETKRPIRHKSNVKLRPPPQVENPPNTDLDEDPIMGSSEDNKMDTKSTANKTQVPLTASKKKSVTEKKQVSLYADPSGQFVNIPHSFPLVQPRFSALRRLQLLKCQLVMASRSRSAISQNSLRVNNN
jgi:hypothetical protein